MINQTHLKKEEIFCRNQGVLKTLELTKKVPSLIFLSKLHIDVCCSLAQLQSFDGIQHMTLVNLLSRHSKKAETITAFIALFLRGDIDIIAIRSNILCAEILEKFINIDKVNFYTNKKSKQWLDVSFFRLTIKYGFHQLYRIFFKKNLQSEVAIRSWVEITEKMYGEQYPTSLILIYPFYFNFKRHFKYIVNSFRTYNKATLCGIPYSFSDLIKILFKHQCKDKYYVNFEINGYKKHAEELLKLGINLLYTSDEFEAGSLMMVSTLKQSDAKVINTSHGLGFNCPFVGYDMFKVYNIAQQNYYQYKSKGVNFIISPRKNAHHSDCIQNINPRQFVLIFIEANFEALGNMVEAKLQSDTIEVIRKIAIEMNTPLFIKAHPNRGDRQCKNRQKNSNVSVIQSLSELSELSPVFITINSAAYYDFRNQGPFIFIDDGFTNLEHFYGESVNSHTLETIRVAIRSHLQDGVIPD